MWKVNTEFELRKRLILGQKEFQACRLRKAELKGVDLSHTDLRGADLSSANLRAADLSYADLRGACLNEADLMGATLKGANLEGASLIKTFLIRANLEQANLTDAYLTGAFLTNANFSQACLNGAYLNDADLNGTNFKGAHYSDKTQLPLHFNPVTAKMEKSSALNLPLNQKITVAELLNTLNELTKCSSNYLGNTLTAKYLVSSRPDSNWLKNFDINQAAVVTFSGNLGDIVTTVQLKWFEQWLKAFIKVCSVIIQDFPSIIDNKGLKLGIILNQKIK